MTPTTARSLAERYRLPVATTAEIVGEATRQAMLRFRWCWALLVVGQVGAVGLARLLRSVGPKADSLNTPVLLIASQLVLTMWHLLGRRLAQPEPHPELTQRATRVHPEQAA